jgi:hypothetical protein
MGPHALAAGAIPSSTTSAIPILVFVTDCLLSTPGERGVAPNC